MWMDITMLANIAVSATTVQLHCVCLATTFMVNERVHVQSFSIMKVGCLSPQQTTKCICFFLYLFPIYARKLNAFPLWMRVKICLTKHNNVIYLEKYTSSLIYISIPKSFEGEQFNYKTSFNRFSSAESDIFYILTRSFPTMALCRNVATVHKYWTLISIQLFPAANISPLQFSLTRCK